MGIDGSIMDYALRFRARAGAATRILLDASTRGSDGEVARAGFVPCERKCAVGQVLEHRRALEMFLERRCERELRATFEANVGACGQ